MNKVSAIICACNEEKTIKDVVMSVSMVPIISEIIIVNDGSDDKTMEIIENLKNEISFTAIHFSGNSGKGYTMAACVEIAVKDISAFNNLELVGKAFKNQIINIKR